MLFLHYGVGMASPIVFSRFAPEVNGSSGAFYFSGQARPGRLMVKLLSAKKQKRAVVLSSPVRDFPVVSHTGHIARLAFISDCINKNTR
jgi:hypothetical protein